MGESMCLEGATDALAFEAYVEHVLAPSLSEGQVVLDKLLVGHRRTQKVKDLIEERGADLVFLPSYSPEMNPIERRLSARSSNSSCVKLWPTGARGSSRGDKTSSLRTVTTEDGAGWFAHAGYCPQDQSL